DQGVGGSAVPVCVIRTYFARTGAKLITVDCPLPSPSATGVPQLLPSIDTSTLNWRGEAGGGGVNAGGAAGAGAAAPGAAACAWAAAAARPPPPPRPPWPGDSN